MQNAQARDALLPERQERKQAKLVTFRDAATLDTSFSTLSGLMVSDTWAEGSWTACPSELLE